MSCQKGNSSRTRAQKHKNKTSFKNNLHDTSQRTKLINSLQVSNVCARCKEVIEWKIKYKKYKPLTQPKTCVKCLQKNVRKAYHVMCVDCGRNLKVCTKCCQSKDVVQTEPTETEQIKLDNEMKTMLQSLPERKRRTFIRYMNRKGKEDGEERTKEVRRDELMIKLNELEISTDQDDDDEFRTSETEDTEEIY